MTIKRIGMLVLAVMMIGVWGAMPASAADPIKVKFAHISPPDPFKSPVHAGAVAFKHVFEMQTGGKYEVEIFPSGTMGKEVDVMEALQNNVIQLSLASAAGFSPHFPAGDAVLHALHLPQLRRGARCGQLPVREEADGRIHGKNRPSSA